jgi:hypothetical protein
VIKVINVIIVDKTLLNEHFDEHLSFNWILAYEGY